MTVLRTLLGVVGGVLVLLAFVVLAFDIWPAFFWLAGIGAMLIVGAVFEHGRYKDTERGSPGPGWEPTGERFTDPSSGEVVTVYYQPSTGERRYVSR